MTDRDKYTKHPLPTEPGTVIDVLDIYARDDLVAIERFVRRDVDGSKEAWISLSDGMPWTLEGGVGWSIVAEPPHVTLLRAKRQGVHIPDTMLPKDPA